MKILVMLQKDVYNIPALKVVEEMEKRKHDVLLYSVDVSNISIRMFGERIVKPIDELSEETVNNVDIIYSAVPLEGVSKIWSMKKYIFVNSINVMDDYCNVGDYTFLQRDVFDPFLKDYSLNICTEYKCKPSEVVGNPKYDVERKEKDLYNLEKNILFIDSSHFPFGKQGKMELAKCVLSIAKAFSDYTITIKPRFLPEDKSVTHRNKIHLYQCLEELTNGNIPKNLVCLQKHVDLEPLVINSNLIICPEHTSTYMEAAVFHKKGLVLTGIPTEFTVSHNEAHIRRFAEIESSCGLCVPYKDVLKYIPEGKIFNEEHAVRMGLRYRNASIKIVDRMEEIFDKYISKGMFLVANDETTTNFEDVLNKRFQCMLLSNLEGMQYRLEEVDFTPLMYKYINTFVHNEFRYTEYDKYHQLLWKDIHEMIVLNKGLLSTTARRQSYYLQSLYALSRIECIEEKEIVAHDMYNCLMGKHCAIILKDFEKGKRLFLEYFDGVKDNPYEKTLADVDYYKESAMYWLGICHYELKEYKEAIKCFEECIRMTNGKHKMAAKHLDSISKIGRIEYL